MGEGDPRQSRRHRPATVHTTPAPGPAARKPAAKPTARKPTVTSRLGTQRPPVTRMPAVLRTAAPAADRPGAPLISRTATLDDPLTTSLLAEVARQSRTIEVSAEQIDEAMDLEPGDRDPDDPT
jgi:hypothetical protein